MDDTLHAVPQVPADDQVAEQPDSQSSAINNRGAVEETKLTAQPTTSAASQMPESETANQPPAANFQADGDRQYDEEIKSNKIETPRKTFFLDLKANSLGRYVKISERSSGKRSTIIVPEETVGEFIQKIQQLFS